MRRRLSTIALLSALAVAGLARTARAQEMGCPYRERPPLAVRPSPLDSVMFTVGGGAVKVCYGRPSARGRTMLGGENVPYGRIWRTGANETTKIITTAALSVAGLEVPAGIYALYTVPGPTEWEVILNRSYQQWGHESTYTDSVRAQEVGRAKVKSERLESPVETFTIRAVPVPDGLVHLILEWEQTQVRVPVTAKRGGGPAGAR